MIPDLKKIMDSSFSSATAAEKLTKYLQSPDDEACLLDAYYSLLPVFGDVLRSREKRYNRDPSTSDYMSDGILSDLLLKLWEYLRQPSFLKSYEVIPQALSTYWSKVATMFILTSAGKELRQKTKEADPRVVSALTPLAGSMVTSTYNKILIESLPKEILKQAYSKIRFTDGDLETCRVVLQSLVEGSQPPLFLIRKNKWTKPSRIPHLVNYCSVLLRMVLMDMRAQGSGLYMSMSDEMTVPMWALLVDGEYDEE